MLPRLCASLELNRRARLSKSSSWTDVLRGTTTFAKNESLRLTPPAWHSKSAPYLRPSSLHEIDAVWRAGEGHLEVVVGVIAFAAAVEIRASSCGWLPNALMHGSKLIDPPSSRSTVRRSRGACSRRPPASSALTVSRWALTLRAIARGPLLRAQSH
jgi:hypothetical protein